MVGELVELCNDTIQALLKLKTEEFISESELERHLEKKILFIDEFQ
ncbi:MAG: hypothetical protein GX053_01305 [Tissierella sp.]|nr:hypothetical protein [Tissierella sp.]